jgi:hypothetical protein
MQNNKSRYVFSAAIAGLALGSGIVDHNQAKAAIVVTDFTFETSQPAATAANIGPLAAEVGTGSAFAIHALSTTVYSSPAGNGSSHSFSSNTWSNNDYYEFDVPTTGVGAVVVSFDQTSSGTGPKNFVFQYSTDGTNFVGVSTYSPIINAAGTTGTVTVAAWNAATSQPAYNFSFDLSSVTALNNDPNAKFRLVEDGTGVAATGTDRVDNFVVSVPEPAELSLLTIAAATTMFRRRTAR